MEKVAKLIEDGRKMLQSEYDNSKLMLLCALVGFPLVFDKLIWTPASGFYKYFLRPRRNLTRRYQGKWAIVTGASYGIGEQVCHELAKSGFNIVLMSRNETLLETVAKTLSSTYNVETRILTFDFQDLITEEGVSTLYSKLDTIKEDICLVVNNAGKANVSFFHQMTLSMSYQIFTTNIYSYYFIC